MCGYFAFSQLLGMEREDPGLHRSGPLTLGLAQIFGSNAQAPGTETVVRARSRWELLGVWDRREGPAGSSGLLCFPGSSVESIPHLGMVTALTTSAKPTLYLTETVHLSLRGWGQVNWFWFWWLGGERGMVDPQITWPRAADSPPIPSPDPDSAGTPNCQPFVLPLYRHT